MWLSHSPVSMYSVRRAERTSCCVISEQIERCDLLGPLQSIVNAWLIMGEQCLGVCNRTRRKCLICSKGSIYVTMMIHCKHESQSILETTLFRILRAISERWSTAYQWHEITLDFHKLIAKFKYCLFNVVLNTINDIRSVIGVGSVQFITLQFYYLLIDGAITVFLTAIVYVHCSMFTSSIIYTTRH